MGNSKLIFHARLPDEKILQVVHCFAMDLTATETTRLTELNRNSINTMFAKLRRRIYQICKKERLNRLEHLRIDKSLAISDKLPKNYPGSKVGITIWAFTFKTHKLGLSSKKDSYEIVHTEIVYTLENPIYYQKPSLKPVNNRNVISELRARTHLFRVSEYPFKYFHPFEKGIFHIMTEFAPELAPNFSFYAHERMRKFNGTTTRKNLIYHLKETEWRINHRFNDLYAELVKSISDDPL